MLLSLLFIGVSAEARGSVRTKGYTTKRGTYVAPSHRTKGNHTKVDNYSTKGNSNPYTGKKGSK
ncbi:hypothetical protein HMI50_02530 [Corallococcus carmarthensis]|nr:hypothetical protein [Corallococcus carmarthensis]